MNATSTDIDIQNGITLSGKKFDFALISRRSIHRAGTFELAASRSRDCERERERERERETTLTPSDAGMRYVVRGIDEHGNVANYVETEQLLVQDTTIASFVQTRGSIPVFWAQKANLKYKPKPELLRAPEAAVRRCSFSFRGESVGTVSAVTRRALIDRSWCVAAAVHARAL